jgi:type I restriction enzyme S subunit
LVLCDPIELSSDLSQATSFVRLGSIARIEKGQTGIASAAPGKYPLVVTAESRSSCDHYDFEGLAAIVPLVSSAGHGKASLQRLHYQEGKFALGSILAAILPFAPDLVSPRFLYEYLTAFKEELLVARMIGTANVSLSVAKVAEIPVPLVIPSVQRRVDELMTLCDGLSRFRLANQRIGFLRFAACADSQGAWHGGKVSGYGER